jgi:pimeloyl-ACP methyl ester carboxylesterase
VSAVDLARRTTAGGGVPVVLLHGLGDTAATWSPFAESLDRPTIAFDLRGHGSSPRCTEYTVDSMVADVLAALGALGGEPVDLAGHSMGGHVASQVALRAPDLVRRLVLEDSPVPPRSGPPLPDPNPPERPAEPLDFDWAVVGPMRRALRATNPLWWQGIERLPTPTLWLSGGPSSHIEPAGMAKAAAAMPNARMQVIPVGHLIHADALESFVDAVVPFLA